MTTYEVTQALLRRWWVVTTGLGLTLFFVLTSVPATPIYWARYDLNLVAPDRSGEVYSRTSAPEGVTPVAGVLEVILGGNHAEPRAATQAAPIFGLRPRTGVEVSAKDKGFQWSRDYAAALAVQIAEPSRAEVLSNAESLARRARWALKSIQDQQGVAQSARLTLEEPDVIEIVEIYPARTRAMAGALLLGTCLSLVLAVLLDRLLARRRAPRRVTRAQVTELPDSAEFYPPAALR